MPTRSTRSTRCQLFSQNISAGWRRLRCRGPAVHGAVDGGAGGGGQVLAARGGDHPHLLEVRVLRQLAKRATKLRITAGHEADADLGPVISPQAKVVFTSGRSLRRIPQERICSLIQSAVDEGAELMIDGREVRRHIFGHMLEYFGNIGFILDIFWMVG